MCMEMLTVNQPGCESPAGGTYHLHIYADVGFFASAAAFREFHLCDSLLFLKEKSSFYLHLFILGSLYKWRYSIHPRSIDEMFYEKQQEGLTQRWFYLILISRTESVKQTLDHSKKCGHGSNGYEVIFYSLYIIKYKNIPFPGETRIQEMWKLWVDWLRMK